MIKCSVGVIGYNEEQNIGELLDRVIHQQLDNVEIEEIIVVVSGCTDQTVPIVREYEKKENRIIVIEEQERTGKWKAINLFIQKASTDILVMVSADVLPKKDIIEKLVVPFKNYKIGMTGAHVMPKNDPNSFMGYGVHFFWKMFDVVSRITPKTGEMVAFRRVFSAMPANAVDEACIEFLIKQKGLHVTYIPDALVFNNGPKTAKDFVCQRRRIWWGYFHLVDETDGEFEFISPRLTKMIALIIKTVSWDLKAFIYVPLFISLEALSRFLGWWDYTILKKNHLVWKMAETTKAVL